MGGKVGWGWVGIKHVPREDGRKRTEGGNVGQSKNDVRLQTQ